jgi:hypothetical protein
VLDADSCVALHTLYKATLDYLAVSRKRVRQGAMVGDSLDFARYVMMSRMCDLMRENPPQGENARHRERLINLFPYNGDQLYAAADSLRLQCGEFYSQRTKDSPGTASGPDKSDIEELGDKMDLVLKKVAQLELASINGVEKVPTFTVV